MRPVSRNNRVERGFTLVEMLLAMILTVLLMVAASQLLVSMKRSSDRMHLNSEARQRAQRALDYIAFQLRGAGDMNATKGNPAAIITWLKWGGGPHATTSQASFNNVTNANLADVGTDIITIARPDSNLNISCFDWPGYPHASNARWDFKELCPDGQANLDAFKQLTGEHGGKSDPVMVMDSQGNFVFYMITNYLDSQNIAHACNPNFAKPGMHVVANPGQSDMLNPPGGPQTLQSPPLPHMALGVKFYAYRVRNGWLEQKQGMFDPATDNPGTNFVPLMPNIEDFQVAWVFDDGTIWNSSTQQLPTGTYPGSVPSQDTNKPYDVTHVRGFRVSIVARSSSSLPVTTSTTFRRPAVEDRAAGTPDKFYHQRATSLLMIRNRNLRQ